MAANERTLSPERVTESTRLVCHDQISLNIGLGEARLQRLRRSQDDSLSELARSWRLGISLAILSGVLFTASNFLIQYFQVMSLEVLLVRSVIQSVGLGLCLVGVNFNRRRLEKVPSEETTMDPQEMLRNPSRPSTVWIFVFLQAIFGAIRLYLNFECLAYLPLGDALTLIFTEPLFTMLFSCIAINFRFGLFKLTLCFGLLSGMVLCVQPPIFFSRIDPLLGIENMTVFNGTGFSSPSLSYPPGYYTGVGLAIGCAICGSLCNIFIKKSIGVSSSGLVFFAGIFGIIVSIVGCLFDQNGNRIVSSFEEMSAADWIVLTAIAVIGITAYFTMTVSLKLISPTSVSVLRALEILLAYLCQIVVMGQIPNATCLGGAILVMVSVIGIAVEEKLHNNS